jgi:hypothetical protein
VEPVLGLNLPVPQVMHVGEEQVKLARNRNRNRRAGRQAAAVSLHRPTSAVASAGAAQGHRADVLAQAEMAEISGVRSLSG